jgi:D-serine deaminase-like pyridoxal phosphate-dependent protein
MTAAERVISGFVEKPCLLIDEQVARSNIRKMAEKARNNGVGFRPHFKTHQSETIGEWFWDEGVRNITVSSVDMADYFAGCGWTDITIASPVNLLQMRKINQLAYDIDLNLVVDSADVASEMIKMLDDRVGVYIKIDTGAGRCGLSPLMAEEIMTVASMFAQSRDAVFRGLLTHSGHTYRAESDEKVKKIWENDRNILTELKQHLKQYCEDDIIISTGDTPGCTLVDDLSWADEIRPGNFVFYDLFQWNLGVCEASDIACVMACPVISSNPRRGELIIYGGAVHFSKDVLNSKDKTVYGLMGRAERNGSITPDSESPLLRLWQEHGLISVNQETAIEKIPGDMVFVFPVHSCLTLDAVRYVKTTEGKNIRVMGK